MKTLFNQFRAVYVLMILLLPLSLIGQSAFPTGYGWVAPRVSQQAQSYQKVGVTEIKVVYSRPYVKERNVWEEPRIAPYDKVWRAGANEATTISFSTDVQVAGQDLKAGKYAFFLIPKKTGQWTAIFNKVHSQWGAFTYNESQDALRVDVSAEDAAHREAMELSFPDLTADGTNLVMRWAKKKVIIPISVDASKTTAMKADATFDWQAGFFAAQHFLRIDKDLEQGLKWANASIAMQENYSNLGQKLTILEKLGKMDEAKEVAQYILKKAEGKEDRASKYWKGNMEKKLKDWGQ